MGSVFEKLGMKVVTLDRGVDLRPDFLAKQKEGNHFMQVVPGILHLVLGIDNGHTRGMVSFSSLLTFSRVRRA